MNRKPSTKQTIVLLVLFLIGSFFVGDLMWKMADPAGHGAFWSPWYYQYEEIFFIYACGIGLVIHPTGFIGLYVLLKKVLKRHVDPNIESIGKLGFVLWAVLILFFVGKYILFR